jgi:hypothetical protein
LRFDRKKQWGQIRPLNELRVLSYYTQLLKNPPGQPVRILVRRMHSGMPVVIHADSACITTFSHRGPICRDRWPTHCKRCEKVV